MGVGGGSDAGGGGGGGDGLAYRNICDKSTLGSEVTGVRAEVNAVGPRAELVPLGDDGGGA